jgi:hypothetical protein
VLKPLNIIERQIFSFYSINFRPLKIPIIWCDIPFFHYIFSCHEFYDNYYILKILIDKKCMTFGGHPFDAIYSSFIVNVCDMTFNTNKIFLMGNSVTCWLQKVNLCLVCMVTVLVKFHQDYKLTKILAEVQWTMTKEVRGSEVSTISLLLYYFRTILNASLEETIWYFMIISTRIDMCYFPGFFLVFLDYTNGHSRRPNLTETTPLPSSSRSKAHTSKSMGKIQVRNDWRAWFRYL